MITTDLQSTVDDFACSLETNEVVSVYQEAKRQFEENPELRALRTTYSERLPELQQKQEAGTLTQEDVASLRSLQERVNQHPVIVEMLRTGESASSVLHECNSTISRILGFDFSANAAPARCC